MKCTIGGWPRWEAHTLLAHCRRDRVLWERSRCAQCVLSNATAAISQLAGPWLARLLRICAHMGPPASTPCGDEHRAHNLLHKIINQLS